MVTEIRRRASNKSTETASKDIVNFLIPHAQESANRGWLLLNVLSLLAGGGQVKMFARCSGKFTIAL